MKKTPLVGVFFIGGDGEPLEITASRESGRLEGSLGAACPERSEEVQYLSISAKSERVEHLKSVRLALFCAIWLFRKK